jgi:uncharacterized protein YbaP (TraB family)
MHERYEQWRLIMAILLFSFVCLGTPFYPVHAAQKNPSNVFMWSVQGPKSKVFLLGSMHMFKAASYPLEPRIEKAYQSCPRVVFEADLEGPGTDEIRDMMLKLGTYHDGKTLSKEISEKTYALFRERVEANNLKVEQFDTYRPWFAALSIATVELKRLGFTAQNGLDAHFSDEAVSDKKKMIYLETARQQLDLLANALPGKEEDLLKQALEEIAVLEKASTEMVQAWKAGDAARMEAFTQKSLKEFPQVEKKLFTERNKAWTTRILRLLSQEGDVFVVVGAGHLVGKGGLLEMLKAKGYNVVQQ